MTQYEYVLKRKQNFPTPSVFKEKYRMLNYTEILEIKDDKDVNDKDPNDKDPSNNYIGKEVIILYKYPKPLFGNYEKDFMYRGHLIASQKANMSYETHIWFTNHIKKEPVFLSKKRFIDQLEFYISNNL